MCEYPFIPPLRTHGAWAVSPSSARPPERAGRRAGGRLRGCAPEAGHGCALDHGEHRQHLACAVLRRTTPRAPRLG
eukprot:3102374-Prymnesium_polylepis.1